MGCEEIRTDGDYYKKFYDTAPIGFFITTINDGTFLKANPYCVNMLGYKTFMEMQQQIKSIDLYSERKRQSLIKLLQEHGYVTDFDVKIQLPNGKKKWVSLTVHVCGDGDCLEGSIIDITSRKLLERKLLRYQKLAVKDLKDFQKSMKIRISECDSALGLTA